MKAENRWKAIVENALDGVAVRAASSVDATADLLVQAGGQDWTPLQVKWAGEGWPEDVRHVAANLPQSWPSNLILLARRLSPGAIEWLRQRGANWADEAGQARIIGPGGIIVIREPRIQAPQRSRFRWSPSALAVAETILTRFEAPLRVSELADISGWSVPQAAAVLQDFDAQGWTAKRGPARGRGAHRVVTDADALLGAFANALGEEDRVTRLAHRATANPMALLQDQLRPSLEETVTWALSGWAGLELTAPIMSAVPTIHIYVAEDDFAGALPAAIEKAGLREMSEGARVVFWRADPRILAMSTQSQGMPVISAPRLYGDLSSFGARGQDAADHVKRELMGL